MQAPSYFKHIGYIPAAFLHLIFWVVVSAIMLYPLPVGLTSLVDGFDGFFSVWVLGWDIHALTSQPWKLFDANILYPADNVLALGDNFLGLMPIYAPAYWLSSDLIAAQNLTIWASHVIMALGIWFWVERETKNRWVAIITAFIITFAPERLGYFGWLQHISTPWMPFAFMALREMLRSEERKWPIIFTISYVLQCMCGLYLAYFTTLAVIIFFVSYVIVNRKTINRKNLTTSLATSLVLGLPILLAVFLPYMQNIMSGDIASKGLSYYFSPILIIASAILIWPLVLFRLYVFISSKSSGDHASVIFACIALCYFLLSLGAGRGNAWWTPFGIFLKIIPGMELVKIPKTFIYPFLVLAALPVGVGINELWNSAKSRDLPADHRVNVLAISFLVLFYGFTFYAKCIRSTHGYMAVGPTPVIYNTLLELPGSDAVIELPFRNREIFPETIYMFYSLTHLKPIANGYNSRLPHQLKRTEYLAKGLPKAESLNSLRALGVKWIIVHEDLLSWVKTPPPLPGSFHPGIGWKYDKHLLKLVSHDETNKGKMEMSYSMFRWITSYMGLQKFLISLSKGGFGEISIDKNDTFPGNELIITSYDRNNLKTELGFEGPQQEFFDKRISQDRKSFNLTFHELTKVIPARKPEIFWQWMQNQGVERLKVNDLGASPFKGMSKAELAALGVGEVGRAGKDVIYKLVEP